MSLVVWLPLTKDLRNQGLSDVTVTNNGATYSATNGKLGGCYILDGTDDRIQISNLPQPQNISVAMWFKRGANTNTRQFLFTAWNGITLELGTSGTVTCSVATADGQVGYCTTNTPITTSTGWTHICFTFENGVGTKLYINGVFQTATAVAKPISWSTTTGNIGYFSTYLNASVNDFRLYDHALSQMEVKELAKGLVLHYPLNRQGWGQENLASQYIMPGGNNPGSTATTGRTNYYGNYGITIPATENADTYFSIWYNTPLESGKTYTLSAQVSGLLNGSYYNFPLFAQNNSSMGLFKIDHNGLVSLTFTMNYTGTIATYTIDNKTHYRMFMDDISRSIASGQGPITITNIKLENGEQQTPWCPNSSDALATTIGLNSTTEYDCSGFCNNGTRTGTFSWTSDTPKYQVSQVFNGTDNAIQTPNLTTMITDKNYTVACWTYKTVIGTKNYQTIYGGPSGFELEARSSSSTSPLYRIHNWGGGTTAYNFGEWTHFCFVHTDSDSKLYVNGELKITGTSANIPSGNYFVGAWNTSTSQNYEGLMSDFRIYATALSADDVKSLYQNSAYIDSSGNVYGAVHSEV